MPITRIGSFIAVIAVTILATACQTTEPGVKSTGFDQYTTIEATTADATKAAAAVLKDLGLLNVESSSTNVDGWASGMKADKSPVKVSMKRVNDRISDINVKVGSYGDSQLGKDIIARVRKHLGLVPPSTAPASDSATK